MNSIFTTWAYPKLTVFLWDAGEILFDDKEHPPG